MSLIQLDIKGISYSQSQTGAYALVLSEMEGERTLPVVIGAFEAQSIAIAIENEIKPPRPLAHDLFKTFAEQYGIKLKEVIIHKLLDGVFYSSLICEKDGAIETFDSRTSDAIALAIRFGSPIYTYENILDKAGVILKYDEFIQSAEATEQEEKVEAEIDELMNEVVEEEKSNPFENMSTADLHKKMNEAIAKEDYEAAALIRDELTKR